MLSAAVRVVVKLYATLGQYLPGGAKENTADLEVPAGATPSEVIRRLNLPLEACHLVLINGNYVAPSERDARRLVEGDALAIWPPVAGG